jgi:benzoyl-CoA reductase/2-hydroxyglutaryl-CoA dehydratase subunit BcrC/BadD/HgdB
MKEKMMEAMDRLSTHLKTRLVDLGQAKEEGRKLIGYPTGGYMPEELVLAAGAIPVCLARGGDHAAVEHSSAFISRWIDTFCRAQIGYGISGEDPYYNIIDLLAIPITDNNVRAISDVLDYNTDLDVFPFGVPHKKDESTYRYYLHGIGRLKTRLEEVTGNVIEDEELEEAIKLCNRERELLKKISLLRMSAQPPISSKDFIALSHGSLLADKSFMVDILESVYDTINEQPAGELKGPRILLTGSTLASGDSRIIKLIDDSGGMVVMEEFDEGLRPYWGHVSPNGDCMASLAHSYFMERVTPAWFRPAKERRDFLLKLCRDFQVDGVIWYHLMYRDSHKIESYLFQEQLKKTTGLPMLILESDYDPAEIGPMQTRVETFIQTIGG